MDSLLNERVVFLYLNKCISLNSLDHYWILNKYSLPQCTVDGIWIKMKFYLNFMMQKG